MSVPGVALRRLGTLFCCVAVLWIAPSRAQYLQIPDFRHTAPPRETAAQPCDRCGVIRSIRETRQSRSQVLPPGVANPAMSSGGPDAMVRIGAVMALPMGEQGTESAFVGGVGTPEMRARFEESTYEVTVRLDNGAYSVLQRRDGGRFRVGDRVRVQGVNLELTGG